MTPAVIDNPELSPSWPESSDAIWDLCEYREDLDPLALLVVLGTSRTEPPSSGLYESCDLSLCIFRPKKDLPAEDWRDLPSTFTLLEGICLETTPFLHSRTPRESDVLQLDDSTEWSLGSCKDVKVLVINILNQWSFYSVDVPSNNLQGADVCQGFLHRPEKHAKSKERGESRTQPVKG